MSHEIFWLSDISSTIPFLFIDIHILVLHGKSTAGVKWDDTKRSDERMYSTFVFYTVEIPSKNYAVMAVNATTVTLWEHTKKKKKTVGFSETSTYIF
jgi:hypothetical protein